MRKGRFQDGVHPTSADMNSLGDSAEGGFSDLLQAISGSPAILFDRIAPIVVWDGTTMTVQVVDQWFAVSGAVQKVVGVPFVQYTPAADLRVDVYLAAGRLGDNQTRDFTSVSQTTGAVLSQQLSTQVALDDAPRVEYATTSTPSVQPAAPLSQTDDAGQVLLATVTLIAGVVVVTTNDQADFVAGLGALHALTHLPGGSDALPLASSSGPGLVGSADYLKIQAALLSVLPAADTTYLTAAESSGNVLLSLVLHDSLSAQDVGGVIKLGATQRAKNALNGQEDSVARADHRHTALEGGLLVQVDVLDVSTTLGSVVPITFLPQSVGTAQVLPAEIVSVSVYWVPPNTTTPGFGVEVGWMLVGQGFVGARAIITGSATYQIEVGDFGAAAITAATTALIALHTAPSYGGSVYPTSGQLRVVTQALAHGATTGAP